MDKRFIYTVKIAIANASILCLSYFGFAQSKSVISDTALANSLHTAVNCLDIDPVMLGNGEATTLKITTKFLFRDTLIGGNMRLDSTHTTTQNITVGKDFLVINSDVVDIYSTPLTYIVVNKQNKTISVLKPRPHLYKDSVKQAIKQTNVQLLKLFLKGTVTHTDNETKLNYIVNGEDSLQNAMAVYAYEACIDKNSACFKSLTCLFKHGIYMSIGMDYSKIDLPTQDVETLAQEIATLKSKIYPNYKIKNHKQL
jgi:hypothetical protein